MAEQLATTNLLLGIMAAVSVLEGLLIVGLGVGAFMVYRKLLTVLSELEQRQVAPAMQRVNAVLDDLKAVSETVKEETGRVDRAIRTTMDRVDDTADRVRTNVRAKTSRVVGIMRGLRVAIESMLRDDHQHHAGA